MTHRFKAHIVVKQMRKKQQQNLKTKEMNNYVTQINVEKQKAAGTDKTTQNNRRCVCGNGATFKIRNNGPTRQNDTTEQQNPAKSLAGNEYMLHS